MTQLLKNLPAMQETRVRILGQKGPLEEEINNPFKYSCLEYSMDMPSLRGCEESERTEKLTHTCTKYIAVKWIFL